MIDLSQWCDKDVYPTQIPCGFSTWWMSLWLNWQSIVSSAHVLTESVMWQGCHYPAMPLRASSACVDSVSEVTWMSLRNSTQIPCGFCKCVDSVCGVTGMLLRNPTQIPCSFSKCIDSVSGVTGISLLNLRESIVSSMLVLIDWVWYVTGITLHLRVCVSSVLVWVSDECHFPTSVQYVSSVHVLTEYDVKEREQ